MAKTVIGLFSNHSEAQQAIQELVAAGFARQDIAVIERNASSAPGAIADNLVGVPEEEARYYSEGITSGRTVVAIKTDDARAREAVAVLERYGAKDLDQREGGAGGASPAMGQPPRMGSSSHSEAARIPVVEEELKVGKRELQRSGVRVYSRISEEPVEKEMSLRREQVSVERHPVNRPATEQDMRDLKEGTVEVSETVEEPVVTKQARVVEEVIVSKDVSQENRKVRDTIRRTEVDVDKISGNGSDKADTTDVNTHKDYGYAFGETLAKDPRYKGRNWNTIEPEAQREWSGHNRGAWEEFKEKIRNAWEKMSGH